MKFVDQKHNKYEIRGPKNVKNMNLVDQKI